MSRNPFTDPRDANLAAAWEYGTAIGKRRERVLIAMFAIGLAVVVVAWWFT